MLVAIITGAVSILTTLITVIATTRQTQSKVQQANAETLNLLDKKSELTDAKLEAKLERHQAVTDTKIDELTREVRQHNDFAVKIPVLEEKIKVANNRISDLEKRGTAHE